MAQLKPKLHAYSLPLQGTSAGDLRAFRLLYDESLPTTTLYLSRLLGPQAQLPELLQRIFTKLHRSLPNLQQDHPSSPSLYQLTRTAALEHLRDQKKTISLDDWRPLRASGLAWHRLDAGAKLRALYTALGQLTFEQREAFVLYEFEALSLREIAQMTDSPLNSIAPKIRRAQRQLRLAILRPTSKTDPDPPTDCKDTQSSLFELRQAQLDHPTQNLIEDHLKSCHRCRDYAEKLHSMLDEALRWRPTPALLDPNALFQAILHNILSQELPQTPPTPTTEPSHAPTPRLPTLHSTLTITAISLACLASFHLAAPTDKPKPSPPPPQALKETSAPPKNHSSSKSGPLRLRMDAEKALRERNFTAAAQYYEELLTFLPPTDRSAGTIRLDLAQLYKRHLQDPARAQAHLRYFVKTWPDELITPQAIAELRRLEATEPAVEAQPTSSATYSPPESP